MALASGSAWGRSFLEHGLLQGLAAGVQPVEFPHEGLGLGRVLGEEEP